MKLIQATMKMSTGPIEKKKMVTKLVFLWKEVGLCIHTNPLDRKKWHVSHYNSGMSVLREIRSLEEAKHYMQRLYNELFQDWTFTLEEWDSKDNAEIRQEIKPLVDSIQETIRRT